MNHMQLHHTQLHSHSGTVTHKVTPLVIYLSLMLGLMCIVPLPAQFIDHSAQLCELPAM